MMKNHPLGKGNNPHYAGGPYNNHGPSHMCWFSEATINWIQKRGYYGLRKRHTDYQ